MPVKAFLTAVGKDRHVCGGKLVSLFSHEQTTPVARVHGWLSPKYGDVLNMVIAHLHWQPELIAIDEETDHESMHEDRSGEANCLACQVRNAGP